MPREPTPGPSQEGSKQSDARRQFPSREWSGGGSAAGLFGPNNAFMRRQSTLWFVGVLLLAWLLPPAHAQPAKPPATVAELQQRLADQVAQPQFAAGTLGVKVV